MKWDRVGCMEICMHACVHGDWNKKAAGNIMLLWGQQHACKKGMRVSVGGLHEYLHARMESTN